MSGLFNTFNIARRGMFAQQTALNVVSHNVSNANTEGYSVQRANLKTSEPFGMPSLTTAAEPGQIGTGVEVGSITRSRDEFLDYYVRKETSTLKNYESREQFLSEIEAIFTEPSDTGLATLMTRFWDSLQGLATNPESSTARTLVASNGDALASGIRHNYTQLEDLEANISDLIQNQVFEVGSLFTQIKDLNEQIKAVVVGGKIPNDLLDRRDLLLDKLSERFGFDIEKTGYMGVKIKAKMADGTYKDVLTDLTVNNGLAYVNDIELTAKDKNGNDVTIKKKDIPVTLSELPSSIKVIVYIDGDINKPQTKDVSISSVDDLKKYFNVETAKDANGNDVYVVKNIMPHTVFYDAAQLKQGTLSITPADFNNGSLKGLDSLSFEINDYKTQLNNLAKAIAISVNTIHSNSSDLSVGVNFFDISAETSDQAAKVLSINSDILKDPQKINAGKYLNGHANYSAGNGDRAILLGQLRNTRMELLKINSREDFLKNVFFDDLGNPISSTTPSGTNLADSNFAKLVSNNSGTTLDNYFKSTIAQLGVSNQEAKRMVTNQEALLDQLIVRRESVSGVSLDEEMTNMMQFQRAYEANAKMISVIDQLLDVVVNGLVRR
ncbi:Flagellar hook-associated protein 1 [Caloramator mitchellensis]|uniref:Flagellar hook-associated protein 1 n=1 Tax=Caloramator mitchellensis TaxID=908809 RepID=A0A0R3JZH1_CALMK|nr:flagellar hook-associated protein FlgK [Caloramator mitchellensis]KRQ85989.1 Flagellar hook-associated protein 1 [Caloramator mitchellensis]